MLNNLQIDTITSDWEIIKPKKKMNSLFKSNFFYFKNFLSYHQIDQLVRWKYNTNTFSL